MKIISISTPKERWAVVEVRADGTLWYLPIEQWALVQWEKYRDGESAYNEGQSVIPAVMDPGGLRYITEPIGAPGCAYLGFENIQPIGSQPTGATRTNWDKKKEAYLKTKEPS